MKPTKSTSWSTRFDKLIARTTGQPFSFLIAVFCILLRVLTGPLFHFNNTWQLVINIWTTIVTFLMVFLIQNTQNNNSPSAKLRKTDRGLVLTLGDFFLPLERQTLWPAR